MLPFLKNRDDGVGQGPVETLERKPDDDSSLDMLDAVAADILDAIKHSDKSALKAALSALCDHIQDQDMAQDQEMPG